MYWYACAARPENRQENLKTGRLGQKTPETLGKWQENVHSKPKNGRLDQNMLKTMGKRVRRPAGQPKNWQPWAEIAQNPGEMIVKVDRHAGTKTSSPGQTLPKPREMSTTIDRPTKQLAASG